MLRVCFVLVLLLLAPVQAEDGRTTTIKEDKLEILIRVPDQPLLVSWASAASDAFRAQFKEWNEEDGAPLNGWSLDIDYTPGLVKQRLECFLLHGYDYKGGAHGVPFFETFFIDRKTNKRVATQELFKDFDSALKLLSDESRRRLVQKKFERGDEWMLKGTEPKPENFQVVFPTEKGLQVIFPSYQVAPYAAGSPEVLIPYKVLGDSLNDVYLSN